MLSFQQQYDHAKKNSSSSSNCTHGVTLLQTATYWWQIGKTFHQSLALYKCFFRLTGFLQFCTITAHSAPQF